MAPGAVRAAGPLSVSVQGRHAGQAPPPPLQPPARPARLAPLVLLAGGTERVARLPDAPEHPRGQRRRSCGSIRKALQPAGH